MTYRLVVCVCAVVLLAFFAQAADFIRFFFNPTLAVVTKAVWVLPDIKLCLPFDRGILWAKAKSIGDVAQLMGRNARSASDDISVEKGVHTASSRDSLSEGKRTELVPLQSNVVFTISIIRWMLSLSGHQLLNVIRVIMDVICYGVEPDLAQISPKNRPSFTAILDQISSLCVFP